MNIKTILLSASVFLIAAQFAGDANALPVTGTAISGSTKITTVTQSGQKTDINWRDFSISPDETINFVQPTDSVVINRITAGNNTFMGQLQSNGHLVFVGKPGASFTTGSSLSKFHPKPIRRPPLHRHPSR